MTYRVEKLPDEPIVLLTLAPGYDLETDFPHSYADTMAILDSVSEPVFYVNDFSAVQFDMNVLIQGASKTAGQRGTYHHPNVKEVIIISPNIAVQMSAQGLKSDVFGNVNIVVFATIEEGLAHARAQS
ncbi:MAG: hypothetical protein JXJ20_07410 [Anaerolineae bacterium]|nr:hypothetical protein [Anaerolineae bacterium]